jgi:hypothetical protein
MIPVPLWERQDGHFPCPSMRPLDRHHIPGIRQRYMAYIGALAANRRYVVHAFCSLRNRRCKQIPPWYTSKGKTMHSPVRLGAINRRRAYSTRSLKWGQFTATSGEKLDEDQARPSKRSFWSSMPIMRCETERAMQTHGRGIQKGTASRKTLE